MVYVGKNALQGWSYVTCTSVGYIYITNCTIKHQYKQQKSWCVARSPGPTSSPGPLSWWKKMVSSWHNFLILLGLINDHYNLMGWVWWGWLTWDQYNLKYDITSWNVHGDIRQTLLPMGHEYWKIMNRHVDHGQSYANLTIIVLNKHTFWIYVCTCLKTNMKSENWWFVCQNDIPFPFGETTHRGFEIWQVCGNPNLHIGNFSLGR